MEGFKETYHPRRYWDQVAEEISRRGEGNFIAGDDEPYYRYKRKKFLRLFRNIPFQGKSVLEVGCGPGGNLAEAALLQPKSLTGVDVSDQMLTLADRNLAALPAELFLVRDGVFPFEDKHFDIVFTSTVLQHTTSDQELRQTVQEMCRVCKKDIYIFERIEKKITGNESCLGRTVGFYGHLFAEHGFLLEEKKFLNIQVSYLLAGLARKLFNRRSRKEGEQLSSFSLGVQKFLLPLTKMLDKLYRQERDLAMLHFKYSR